MKISLDGLTEDCKSQKKQSMNLKTDQQKLSNLKNRGEKRSSMTVSSNLTCMQMESQEEQREQGRKIYLKKKWTKFSEFGQKH